MILRNLIFAAVGMLNLMVSEVSAQCIGTLVWSDEFNGSSLDMTKWNYETGNGCPALCGWGNNEMEYYTNSTNNTRVTGGNLVLEARSETISGSPFSSGKILSRNIAFWTYGRFEANMRLPEGRGLWPAFWMLPEVNNWPTTGEIDIMEYRGDINNRTSGTLHYGNPWPGNLWDGTDYFHTANLASAFHVYAVEWDANEIRWYFDDKITKIETRVPNSLNPASNNANVWPWNANFHIILNLAVGGWFPATTVSTDVALTKPTFEIDYVRVYNMTSAIGTQWPYNGTAAPVPGKVEAEEYDKACDQAAYYDTDLPNNGGAFRGERVDIETCTDAGAGYDVGWTTTGEWMEYTVNVAATGTYDLSFRIANGGAAAGRLHIEMDGTDITGAVNIPVTGGWTNWQNVVATNKPMTAGTHIMRVYVENTGFNLNYINITANTVMPVSLLNFSAEKRAGYTSLQWSTSREENNAYYTIERSTAGLDWQEIGKINAGVNATAIQNYYFDDYSSGDGKIYYRLKQTDIDGKYYYSGIIEVDHSAEISISPNPFTDKAYISLQEEIKEASLCDLTGTIIETVKTKYGETIAIGENVSKGIYMLKLSNGKTYKLIKQ
jgi:beta-glucanase (GH16 family)